MVYILLALILTGVGYGEEGEEIKREIAQKEEQLSELKRSLQARRAEIEALGLKERSLLKAIENLDRRLREKREELRRIEMERKALERKIGEMEERIEELRGKEVVLRERIKERMVAAYRMQKGRLVDFLFSSTDLTTLSRRYRYLEALARYDLDLIGIYRDTVEGIGSDMALLREKRDRLAELKVEIERRRREMLRERRKRERLVKRVRSSRELSLIALKEMEEASLRIESRIEELRRRYRGTRSATGFAALKGELDMPVDGVVVTFYGKKRDPRFNTYTFNKGIEIEAPIGTEVRSIYQGRVVFADWFKGYGLTVIIDNGDGYYTVFAHLSKILKGVGEEVEKGEVIGLVGDTGSLKGPRLYFEIRHHGIPKDPLEWVSMR